MNKKRTIAGLLAVCTVLTASTGCSKKGKEEGTPEVTWYMTGVKQESVHEPVWNKLNEIMEERYGMKLNVILTDSGNFDAKLQMMNAAQEAYDLVFTSNWKNDFATNVENGALYDLTDLLPKEAPTLYKSLSEAEKTATTVDGSLYAVINWQVQARALGLNFPKEVLEASSFSLDDFEKISDLGAYYEEVVAKNPQMNQGSADWNSAMTGYGMITVAQEGMPGVIRYEQSGKPTVINQFESEEFLNHAKMMRDWNKKGIIPKVRNNNSSTVKTGVITNPGTWGNWKPGILGEMQKSSKYEYVGKQISPAVLSTEMLLGTLTAVGAYSTHPDKAVKMMEVMHTDKELYNMLSFGLEGENYEKTGDNTIKVKDGNNYSIPNWSIGSVANSYILDGTSDKIWDETKEFNDSAIVSPIMGFVANTENMVSDYGNCKTVIDEYMDKIQYGYDDPEVLVPEFIKKLKVAGSDRVIEELQKQVDEWWENK